MMRLIIASALALSGCSTRGHVAPSSYMTRAGADQIASQWGSSASGRSYCGVTGSGSMLPDFDANAVLLLEKVRVGDERVGDIVIWKRPGSAGTDDPFRHDAAFVLWQAMAKDFTAVHRIREVRPDGLFVSGDNNLFPDGWVQYAWVQWRVAGILFTNPNSP